MNRTLSVTTLTAVAALTLTFPAQGAIAPATAAAARPASTAPPGHVILKAGGGTIALATTGVLGSHVYAGRYRASNHAEDWHTDHEPGATFPGGRFGLFWAPGGAQTSKYVYDAGAGSAYLVNGAAAGTIFSAVPEPGGYVALVYLAGGTELTGFVLTYNGNGLVTLRGAGDPLKPTADELWKLTG